MFVVIVIVVVVVVVVVVFVGGVLMLPYCVLLKYYCKSCCFCCFCFADDGDIYIQYILPN